MDQSSTPEGSSVQGLPKEDSEPRTILMSLERTSSCSATLGPLGPERQVLGLMRPGGVLPTSSFRPGWPPGHGQGLDELGLLAGWLASWFDVANESSELAEPTARHARESPHRRT